MDFFNVNIKYGSYVENRVLCADGNCETLSDEDLLLARSAFCSLSAAAASQPELSELCKITEPVTTDALWRAAAAFKDKSGLFSQESPLYSMAEIEGSFTSVLVKSSGVELLSEIYAEVARFAALRPFATGHDLVGAVFSAMKKRGIEFRPQPENRVSAGLFFSSLSRREFDEKYNEHFYVDCDISSLIIYTIGKELGWPVSLIVMPQHVVVRWSSETENFVADQGKFFDSAHFQQMMKLSEAEVSHESSPESIIWCNLGIEMLSRRDYEGAEQFFLKSIDADAGNISPLIGLCALKIESNQLEAAREYCDRGVRLYPNFEGSNFFMGILLYKSGDLKSAGNLLQKTVLINPENATAAELLQNIEARQVDNSAVSR